MGPTLNHEMRTKIHRALEAGGVIFLDGNGEGPGVRLRKKNYGAVLDKVRG